MNPVSTDHINVVPVQEFMQYMHNIEKSQTYNEFCIAATAAKTCLQTLKSTHYITDREHYEYQRQLNDAYDRKELELNP